MAFSAMGKIGGEDDVFPFGHLSLRCPVEYQRLANSWICRSGALKTDVSGRVLALLLETVREEDLLEKQDTCQH